VRRFLLARGAQALVVVALVATFTFALVHLAPGDPFGASLDDPANSAALHAEEMHQWGYDQDLPVQYAKWLGNVVRGDFGWSHSRHRRVSEVLLETVPRTLLLMGVALLAGVVAGLALGTWQAARCGTVAERASNAVTLAALSMPEFLVALAAIALPAARWHWFPVSGMTDPVLPVSMNALERAWDVMRHLALPAGTLALLTTAAVSRHHRSAMLTVLPEEFIRTARAKGAGEFGTVVRHALRNALGPFTTIVGLRLPALFGGAVFVETVFGWPGIGRMMVDAATGNDYPLVLAGVIVGSALVALGGALADVLAALADPRVRIDS
jgi:peptide/nickel transport system permease protein